MHLFSYPVKETGFISGLVKDYLSRDSFLSPFYGHYPDMDGILEQIKVRSKHPVDRKLLVNTISEQYRSLGDVHDNVLVNISALEKEHTYTVTTGHQLNVLTGPVFSIYKIITTLKLAEQISDRIKGKVVPVFWMASEDHDIEEIDHLSYHNRRYAGDFGVIGPAGRLDTKPVLDLIGQLEEENRELAFNDLMQLFRKAYSEHSSLSDATRSIMNSLFGKYGLVILDADDRRLKSAFSSIMEEEIRDQTTWARVNSSGAVLEERYKLLVNPRKINLFYLDADGRHRITHENDDEFALAGGSRRFTIDELITLLKDDPGSFSPNVILRTVYQEKILPNICYVGGPGEVSYWLQFKAVFDEFEIPFPCIVLRNSFLLLNGKVEKKMKALALKGPEIFLAEDQLVNILLERSGELFNEEEYQMKLEALFGELKDQVIRLDPTLQFPVEGEMNKAKRSISKIRQKFLRSMKKREQITVDRIKYIYDELFPSGSLQERTANILNFASSPDDDLIGVLYENSDPLDQNIKVIFYE